MKNKDSGIAKRTGLTQKYVDRVENMSDEELYKEYLFYSNDSENASFILKSVLIVSSGFLLYRILKFIKDIFTKLINNQGTVEIFDSLFTVVIIIGFGFVLLVIVVFLYYLRQITKKRSRFMYLERKLKERKLLI